MTDPAADRPPAAFGAGSFNRWLAGGVPMFVAGIVITKFSDNLVVQDRHGDVVQQALIQSS